MWHTIATTAVGLPVLLLFLCVGGQFVPLIGFSIVGSLASGRFVLLSAIAGVLVLASGLLVVASPSVGGVAVLSAAGTALVGALVNGSRQLALARRRGVRVSVSSTIRRSLPHLPPDLNESYATYEGEQLGISVWLPRITVSSAPMILMVHGGGWVMGARNEGTTPSHACWFADRGFVVVSADYSLSDDERHLWEIVETQIAEAVKWTVANAHRLGGDAAKLALIGESAGGNLVLNVGSRIAGGEWDLRVPMGQPVVVRAVSVLYPPTDVRALTESPTVLLRRWIRSLATRYIGGSPSDYPERYDAVDCSRHIRNDSPPSMLAWGTRDHLVPPRTITAFAERLRSAGVPTSTLAVPHSDHGFDQEGTIGCQVWRELTLRWFVSHGLDIVRPADTIRVAD